ncbi:arginine--tRNA ligase [Desulforegula conservatrix]|uniref:arginine--tRNA ligase n=1 Tax=Desulforegula conservatrix TaxID=153026 RepID=UPI0004236D36|nr:arginine--tRNA ligase [Desulforegula conservatrix]
MILEVLRSTVSEALKKANADGSLTIDIAGMPEIMLEEPKIEAHGDFSTNLAMTMAKSQKMPPRKVAEILLPLIDTEKSIIEKVEIAGPGFINFYLKKDAWLPVLDEVLKDGKDYGRVFFGKGQKVQVEFVSANPTGPLHVGHGRGAAVGDAVADLLSFCGYDVVKEYYINDSGRQISTLGGSVYLRFKELHGEKIEFPEDYYQGDYIIDLAKELDGIRGAEILSLPEADGRLICARYAADQIMEGIKDDLNAFGVNHNKWYSEQSLYDSGKVEKAIEDLKARGVIYENDGAWWFRTTDYGDEKDRVVVRSNGDTTYFASDIAYHMEKYERGFDRVIDVWGADHHGYIPRMNACIQASGNSKDKFNVILVQLVALLRAGEPVAMSTRTGEFVTLKEVVDETGKDAARFMFLMRHYDSHLDFDLELAKKKTNENPVYYVQYVHARIASILKKALDEGRAACVSSDASGLIETEEEMRMIKAMARYSQIVGLAGKNLEPHRITFYLMDLAGLFHAFYNKHKVLTEDASVASARLLLISAVQTVIRNGLSLLGISAPEHM